MTETAQKQYTAEEIEKICGSLESAFEYIPKTAVAIAVQIIKQLQAENSECRADMEMEGVGDNDGDIN